MQATYEDASQLEQLVLKAMSSGRSNAKERAAYAELHDKLIADAPSRGPSVAELMASIGLPSDLEQLLKRSDRTKTGLAAISSSMRKVRDVLIDRAAGNPGRHIRKTSGTASSHSSAAAVGRSVATATGRASRRSRKIEDLPPRTELPPAISPASWTGIEARSERLILIRNLLPLARSTIETLIEELSRSGGNGGPLLDERAEALEPLRRLHALLGELLNSVNRGQFNDDLGSGLEAEAIRYAQRVATTLANDPMPYAMATLVIGLLTACGLSDAGAFVAGMALSVTKKP